MGLALTLIALVFFYFSPAEVFPTLAPYRPQLIILVPAAAISFVSLTMRGSKLQTPQAILMIGLWVAVVLSCLSKFWFRASLYAFAEFGMVVCIYFLVSVNAFTLSRVRALAGAVCICAVILAIRGILAYHGVIGEASLVLERVEAGFGYLRRIRAYGVLNDPNDFAQFLLVALALLGVFWKKNNLVLNAAFLSVPAGILIWGVYLTGSRGAMVGLAVILLVVVSSRMGRLPAIALTALFFLVLVGAQFGAGRDLTVHESSATGRLMAWGVGISIFKTHPIFGVGFSHFGEYFELTAHNSFVLCFAELGIFGYFFWLGLILTTVLGLQRLMRTPAVTPQDGELHAAVNGVRAALYSFLVTGWFLSRTYNVTLYVLLGLATALIFMRQAKAPQPEPEAKRWIPLTLAFQVLSLVFIYAMIRLRSL